jgi:nitrate/nitrite transport system substrate-binding protein
MGTYELGCDQGQEIYTGDYMLYHNKGFVNFPRKSHAIWAMAQYVRFDYLKEAPDYQAIADKLIMQDLYKEVAESMKVPIPDDNMKPFALNLDKVLFDPAKPGEYLKMINSKIIP